MVSKDESSITDGNEEPTEGSVDFLVMGRFDAFRIFGLRTMTDNAETASDERPIH